MRSDILFRKQHLTQKLGTEIDNLETYRPPEELKIRIGAKLPRQPKTANAASKRKTLNTTSNTKSGTRHNPLFRPTGHYADLPSADIGGESGSASGDEGKGKTDGSGGGMGAVTTPYQQSSSQDAPSPYKPTASDNTGKGNGPERRKGRIWVPVERRRQP